MKTPLNVLFISIPPMTNDIKNQSDSTASFYVYPPIGVMSLMLKLYGQRFIGRLELLDFGTCDFPLFDNEVEWIDYINAKIRDVSRESSFDVVCISVMFSMSHEFFKIVVNEIHAVFNEAIFICGGFHPTNSTAFIFNDIECVDFIIRGEGEIALPNLLNEVYERTGKESVSSPFPQIKGVISKYMFISGIKRDTSVDFSIADTLKDIDLNFNFYPELFDMDFYTSNTSLFSLSTVDIHAKAFPIMASRGCPVQCAFCAAKTVHGLIPRWRTLENIREEIIWLNKNYGVTKIYLMDDNFAPKAKAVELFEMLRDLPIKDLDIIIQNMSVNHTDYDIIDIIVQAGIKYLPLAIETGSIEMQKKIKKNCNLDKAVSLVNYAQQRGLSVRCFYMIGFPGETISQMQETIDFAVRVGADWSTFSVAVPFPGTEMYNEFAKSGYIRESSQFWKAASIRDRVFDTNEITAEQLKRIAYEANLKVNFLNSPYITKKEYENGKHVFENFLSAIDFHIFAYDSLRRINIELGCVNEAQDILLTMKNKYLTDPRARDFKQYFNLLDKNVVAFIESSNDG